jgi:hypothetical protein
VEKCSKAGHVTDDNMAQAYFTLDTEGYKNSEYVILIAFLLQQWSHESA